MPILVVNICRPFFGKACVPKNTLLDQNCLRTMNTSVIFCAKVDNNLSVVSCFSSGRVWDRVCGTYPPKTQKNPAKRFASYALIPAACEAITRDLNCAARNRRNGPRAALRLSRLHSQTGPKCYILVPVGVLARY